MLFQAEATPSYPYVKNVLPDTDSLPHLHCSVTEHDPLAEALRPPHLAPLPQHLTVVSVSRAELEWWRTET